MSNLFIPETLKVGFQNRDDTFTKRLAYVIYYDSFGKLRKETSWQQWRDEKIEPMEIKNEPTSGFVLNKGIRRYNWSHFSSNRSMIRIYDPRGIEFEVTPENLIGLLMHTDCSRREIQGDMVYAWDRTELVLLPCNSEECESAKKFTSLQDKRISAKELKEGATYVTKQQDLLVYLGRHWYYEKKYVDSKREYVRDGKRFHMFCDVNGDKAHPVPSVPSKIADIINDQPPDGFAGWVDNYLKSPEANKVVGYEIRPFKGKHPIQKMMENDTCLRDSVHVYEKVDGEFYVVLIEKSTERINILDSDNFPWRAFRTDSSKVSECGNVPYLGYRWKRIGQSQTVVEDVSAYGQLYAKLENGRVVKWGP